MSQSTASPALVLPVPTTAVTRTSSSSSLSTSRSTSIPTTTSSQSSAQVTTATSDSIASSSQSSASISTTAASTPTSDTSSSSASPVASVATTATTSTSASPGITSIINGSSTSIYTQFVTPSASATRSVAPSQANTSFFANKGAVAGVFTVVGLIGLAVFIAIVTACIRRRRAKQFDMDVAEAAREAAATSAAHHPFSDDDYTSYGGGGRGGTAYTGHSAESHGTYEQPAMSIGGRGGESYVMSDVGGVGGAGAYDSRYPSVAAGAAGIGAAVGAAAMQRARSRKEYGGGGGSGGGDYSQTQERTPYPAFVAGPAAAAAHNHEMFDQSSSGAGSSGMRYRRGQDGRAPDLLEAAGLLGGAAAVGTTGAGYTNRQSSDRAQYTDLSRNTSQGQEQGRGSEEVGYLTSASPLQYMQATVPSRESYIGNGPYHVVYPLPPPQQQHLEAHTPEPPTPSEDPFRRNTMPIPLSVPEVMSDEHAEEDAYGGYADDAEEDVAHHEGSDESRYSDLHRRRGEGEGRASFQDEEDYGRQPRVLKVANE